MPLGPLTFEHAWRLAALEEAKRHLDAKAPREQLSEVQVADQRCAQGGKVAFIALGGSPREFERHSHLQESIAQELGAFEDFALVPHAAVVKHRLDAVKADGWAAGRHTSKQRLLQASGLLHHRLALSGMLKLLSEPREHVHDRRGALWRSAC